MTYNDFKLNLCTECGNDEIDPNARFCKICGNSLANKCAGKSMDPGGGNIYIIKDSCGEFADNNARFCIKCGCPTTYFESGLLFSWQSEISNQQGEILEENILNNDINSFLNKKELSDEEIPF